MLFKREFPAHFGMQFNKDIWVLQPAMPITPTTFYEALRFLHTTKGEKKMLQSPSLISTKFNLEKNPVSFFGIHCIFLYLEGLFERGGGLGVKSFMVYA